MLVLISIVVGAAVVPVRVWAAYVCWPQRTINQHRCKSGTCSWYVVPCVGINKGGGGLSQEDAYNDCVENCYTDPEGVYPGTCDSTKAYCKTYKIPSFCQVENFYAACSDAPYCQALATIIECQVSVSGEACIEVPQTLVYGCWGSGTNTPTPTPTPGPTSTPEPTPTPGGPTPTPVPGTIQARAMQVSASDTSCTAVRASATGVDGTVHQFTPSSTSQTVQT